MAPPALGEYAPLAETSQARDGHRRAAVATMREDDEENDERRSPTQLRLPISIKASTSSGSPAAVRQLLDGRMAPTRR